MTASPRPNPWDKKIRAVQAEFIDKKFIEHLAKIEEEFDNEFEQGFSENGPNFVRYIIHDYLVHTLNR